MVKRSDDEDLYSSEEESTQPVTKKARTSASVGKEKEKEDKPAVKGELSDDEDEDEEDDSEESDSDDDIEFVIGDAGSKSSDTVKSVSGPLNDTVDELNDDDGDEKEAKTEKKSTESNKITASVDINEVAELDGKPLTQVDLAKLKDKPWRFPGADITDYFNYGFDEFTWTAYCCKQDKLRGEFNPQKVMASIMGGGPPPMPGAGGNVAGGSNAMPMMPPMGMMPGMPMLNMPNFQGMPNMQGMPTGLPNIPNFPNMGGMPKFNNNNNK